MDMPAQRLSRRLQRTLIAFCLLAALFGVVVYITTPSIYMNMLLLKCSALKYNTGEMFSLKYG